MRRFFHGASGARNPHDQTHLSVPDLNRSSDTSGDAAVRLTTLEAGEAGLESAFDEKRLIARLGPECQ